MINLSKKAKIIIGAVVGVLVVAGVIGGSIAIANAVKKNKQAKCEHVYDEGQITAEATCETNGAMLYTCGECDYELVEEIPAFGHTEVEIEGIPATCLETGLTDGIQCSVCEKVLVQPMEIPALGHKPVEDVAIAPTCTASGKTAGSHCERCEVVLEKPEMVAALGHNVVTIEGKAATCESTGLTSGSVCGTCGKVYVAQEVLPVLSHKTEMVAGKAATCTESGLTDGKTCTVCKKVVLAQQTLPALGHSTVNQAAIPATCTESGMTAGSYCASCGDVLIARTEVPALGHTIVSGMAVAPTCTKTGMSASSSCSVCDTVFATQQVIPATGHTLVNGKCSACGYVDYESATFTEVEAVVGEKVSGNWYRIYRRNITAWDTFKVSCKVDGIVSTNEVTNGDNEVWFCAYGTQQAGNEEYMNGFMNFPLCGHPIAVDGVEVHVTNEYVDIFIAEGMTISWRYESAGTVVFDCVYTITADSVITNMDESMVLKRLVMNQ